MNTLELSWWRWGFMVRRDFGLLMLWGFAVEWRGDPYEVFPGECRYLRIGRLHFTAQ